MYIPRTKVLNLFTRLGKGSIVDSVPEVFVGLGLMRLGLKLGLELGL